MIEGLTQKTGDAVYREIATHLLAARACHEALGTMDKFRQYMEGYSGDCVEVQGDHS